MHSSQIENTISQKDGTISYFKFKEPNYRLFPPPLQNSQISYLQLMTDTLLSSPQSLAFHLSSFPSSFAAFLFCYCNFATSLPPTSIQTSCLPYPQCTNTPSCCSQRRRSLFHICEPRSWELSNFSPVRQCCLGTPWVIFHGSRGICCQARRKDR